MILIFCTCIKINSTHATQWPEKLVTLHLLYTAIPWVHSWLTNNEFYMSISYKCLFLDNLVSQKPSMSAWVIYLSFRISSICFCRDLQFWKQMVMPFDFPRSSTLGILNFVVQFFRRRTISSCTSPDTQILFYSSWE